MYQKQSMNFVTYPFMCAHLIHLEMGVFMNVIVRMALVIKMVSVNLDVLLVGLVRTVKNVV